MTGRSASGMLMGAVMLLLAGCAGALAPSRSVCLATLDRHQIAYTPVTVTDPYSRACAIDNAVRVSRIEAPLNHPTVMSCAMASRIDQFEREVVQPLAARELGRRVAMIEHFGAYACRPNSSNRGRFSEHAFGRAIDISGFRLSDGSVASVEHDWWRPGPRRNFLRAVAHNACHYFSVVLTPSSNRDHYNHFHFDIGPGRSCPGV